MAEENQDRKNLTPYADNYKRKYQDLEKKKNLIQKLEKEVIAEEKKIVKEVEKDAEKTWDYVREPRHVRVLKIIAILIPIAIIAYLFYANFLISKDFNYLYDIGSPSDSSKPYLTPANRVSDIINATPDYRTLNSGLVYFDVPIPRGSETIQVETKFQDNFPADSKMSLGAKDQEVWHYFSNLIYNPGLQLGNLYRQDNLYLLNENLALTNIDDLKSQSNIVIATDQPFIPTENTLQDWQGETTISQALRGGHTFYIYISGNLNLEVKKQDINWYNNSDELEIDLYNSNNTLMANTTIPDDGITEVKHGTAIIQSGNLKATNLAEGVYRIDFKDFDGLIREIKVNTKKIVASGKLFLADSSVYGLTNKEITIYTTSDRNSQLKFQTWHKEGLQTIQVNNNPVQVRELTNATLYNLASGDYSIESNKNDLIISYPGYFAFSPSSYFEPFKQRVIPIQGNLDWLKENADYLITNYESPRQDNQWLISHTEFNIPQDNLYVTNNKLSMLFNTPHLSNEDLLNFTIPIDWINITVHKPGLWEKWRGE